MRNAKAALAVHARVSGLACGLPRASSEASGCPGPASLGRADDLSRHTTLALAPSPLQHDITMMADFRSKTFLSDLIRQNMPTREQLEHNRFVRPFAHYVLRPELWRFTRRSVPRGVAAGLLVGIFALIPGIQIVGAALMCVPSRGNIPLAAAMTFLSNPATTPFLLAASLFVGNGLGFHADLASFRALYEGGASVDTWVSWLLSDAAPALVVGLLAIAVVSAALGYVVSAFLWRGFIARKWARRQHRRLLKVSPAE